MNYMSIARLRYALVLFVVAIVAVASQPAVAAAKRVTTSCLTATSNYSAALIEVRDLEELISQQNEVIKQWKSNIEQLSNAFYFNQDPTELARCKENLRKAEAFLAVCQLMLEQKKALLASSYALKQKACSPPNRP